MPGYVRVTEASGRCRRSACPRPGAPICAASGSPIEPELCDPDRLHAERRRGADQTARDARDVDEHHDVRLRLAQLLHVRREVRRRARQHHRADDRDARVFAAFLASLAFVAALGTSWYEMKKRFLPSFFSANGIVRYAPVEPPASGNEIGFVQSIGLPVVLTADVGILACWRIGISSVDSVLMWPMHGRRAFGDRLASARTRRVRVRARVAEPDLDLLALDAALLVDRRRRGLDAGLRVRVVLDRRRHRGDHLISLGRPARFALARRDGHEGSHDEEHCDRREVPPLNIDDPPFVRSLCLG